MQPKTGERTIINTENQKLLAGLHTLLGRPKPNIFYPGFAGYLFLSKTVRTQIQREAQGAKVLGISVGRISKVELNYPSLVEQKKISSLLSTIDTRIQTQNKIIEQLESLIKALADSLIEYETANSQSVELGTIGASYNGLTGKTKEHFGSGERYIQYKQVFDNSCININSCGLVEVNENESQNTVKFGDVIFTISSETPNEIGMSSVLLHEVERVYLNSFCFGFRPNELSEISPYFLRFYFRSSVFRNELQKLAQGSTRYNISKTAFLKLRVKIPDIRKQTKIANTLSAIDCKINIETGYLSLLINQKNWLLKNLFT